MENAQPMLTTATPLSLIILPAGTTGTGTTLTPLTVITTTALNALTQHHQMTSSSPMNTCTSFGALQTLCNAAPLTTLTCHGNTPQTTLTTLPLVTSCLSTSTTGFSAAAINGSAHTTAATSTIGSGVKTTGSSTKTGYSTGTPPLKPAKKFRQEQEEILRCKRRLDFVGSSMMGLQRPHAATVLRRNERERNRVKLINSTFLNLRERLPGTTQKTTKGKAKKLSKVDTLQKAIDYIHALQDLIDEHDAVNAVFDQQERRSSIGSVSSVSGSSTTSSSSREEPLLSPAGSAGESEPMSDEAPLSPEEVDLLDFTSWF